MKSAGCKTRRHRKAQSLVEFALGGILLMMMLAAAVDLGRAYFTWIVVQQMAGEGANYLAFAPDADLNASPPPPDLNQTFQRRAQYVAARAWGSVIDPNNVMSVTCDVTQLTQRCTNVPFKVTVAYKISDLFFPTILGFNALVLTTDEQSTFTVGDPACP